MEMPVRASRLAEFVNRHERSSMNTETVRVTRENALEMFEQGHFVQLNEQCNCGDQVRHNNGGNYHQIITLKREGDGARCYSDSTCELVDEDKEGMRLELEQARNIIRDSLASGYWVR
jgi:hypothetical protein